ncbi:head-tail adaptor protein [Rhizobium sp. LjRoot98]|uniref:phage head completion protein n=1 Tax=Rhizobium sp. LjRoot98 TaxID=3342345 RepID=UPI003ED0BF15
MAKAPSAGAARQKVHFQQRVTLDDGMGNETSDQTIFTDAAEFIPLRGGEGVQAARLTGIQPYVCAVPMPRALWRLIGRVDARSGVVCAITAPPVNTDQKNAWLDIMVTQGRAS